MAWIDPAPAIARRVANLLADVAGHAEHAGAQMIMTSGRPHPPSGVLLPFFGGRIPAPRAGERLPQAKARC